jgi:hypothetical protein
MQFMQFVDHLVPYETFLNDLSSRIVRMLEDDKKYPEYISQRKAFEHFGRSNVMRWKKQGKITPMIRPGKVEYKSSELLLLQRTVQDYFNE